MLQRLLTTGFDKDISIGLINSSVNLNSNEEKIFKCCGFVPLGKASLFIDKIEGDYNTLLGISPSIIYNKLKELGYSVTDFNFEKRK